MLMLVGGPSQLDTWDMKPNAPDRDSRTVQADQDQRPRHRDLARTFPRMAKHADKYSLIRSVYHTAAAVHDTGHQMMQTGRLFQGGVEHPHIGCVLGKLQGPEGRRAAARAAAAADRQHRRQHAARPERRLPRQELRSVRPERRSVRSELPRARYAAAGLSVGAARRPPPQLARDGGQDRSASSKRRRTRGCSTPRSIRPTR